MWLSGGEDGRCISPFCHHEINVKRILKYVDQQDESFQEWHRGVVGNPKNVSNNCSLLYKIMHDPVLDNGNSFIHELIERQIVDWVCMISTRVHIHPQIKNGSGKTILQSLYDRYAVSKAKREFDYLMLEKLIVRFGGNCLALQQRGK